MPANWSKDDRVHIVVIHKVFADFLFSPTSIGCHCLLFNNSKNRPYEQDVQRLHIFVKDDGCPTNGRIISNFNENKIKQKYNYEILKPPYLLL